MVNTLTGNIGLKAGPIVLETLAKHYLERLRKEGPRQDTVQLRQDELLYDEAFNIIRVCAVLSNGARMADRLGRHSSKRRKSALM